MNIQGMFQNSSTPLLEQVVNFGQMRHNVLAGNIANISTPGYQFRDLPQEAFEELLKSAAEAKKSSPAQVMSPAGGLAGLNKSKPGVDPFDAIQDQIASEMVVNSDNRSLEYQVAEITKNQMQHNMALAILNNQFRLMESAVSERV